MDQQQIRPGDGLVVEARHAVVRGEAAQRRREAVDRGEERMLAQIDPRQADVIGVMKVAVCDRASFERRLEFGIGHFVSSRTITRAAKKRCAAKCPAIP